MDLTFILTTAGLAALVNAANTGSNAIVVDRIGLSASVLPGDPEDNVNILALPAEIKRLATFGGDVVADDTIHVTIRDESADVYQLRTFGLYSAAGVLLAFYTQPTAIMEKAASSMLLLAADLKFTTPISAELVFGDTTFINPPATTETMGVVELATAAETAAGVDATRAVTPFSLKSLLTTLLAGYALTGHTHAAADITSGTFAIARIPELAQNKITGLVADLAGKAAAAHTHAMSEITGLVAALATKLAIGDFTWQNLVGKPNVAINGQAAAFTTLSSQGSAVWTAANFDPSTKANLAGATFTGPITATSFSTSAPAGTGRAALSSGAAGVPGYLSLQDGAGVEVGYVGWMGAPQRLRISAAAGWGWEFAARPLFGTATPWDSANFDPATKATLGAAVSFANVSTSGGITSGAHVRSGGIGLGNTLLSPGNADYTGYIEFNTAEAVRLGYIGFAHKTSKQIVYNAENGAIHVFNSRPVFAGATPWDSANFNPADKAAAVHSHDWAQVTGRSNVVEYARNTVACYVPLAATNGTELARVHADTVGMGFVTASGNWALQVRGTVLELAGQAVWTAHNFNPADKAAAIHSHDWAQVTGKEATAAEFRAASGTKALTPTNVWSAAALVAAAQAGTIAVDLSGGLNFTTTMTGNRTLGAPTNAKPGQSGVIQILQDGTGNRTLAFDPAWKFEGGTDPVLSTAANARDLLVFTVIAAGDVVASLMKDVK